MERGGKRLRAYTSLVEAIAAAPAGLPFATMWDPSGDPEERTLTFGDFRDQAAAYAGAYRKHGLQAGDKVVLILPQGLDLLTAFAGALLGGMIPAILAYPSFKVDPEKYAFGLRGVINNLCAPLAVIDEHFPDGLLECLEGVHWERIAVQGEERLPADAWSQPQRNDTAFIQHSAGTTGLQKGVALSHGAVLTQLAHLADALELGPTDRIASWLPLYHDMGLIACFILPLAAHLSVVMQSPTDWVLSPVSFLDLITRHRSTLCWMPNFAYQFLARRVAGEDRAALDLSSLRAVINCSEPVRAASMREFHRAFAACRLRESALQTCYAMAENVFAVTQSGIDGQPPREVFVNGSLLMETGQIRIVEPDDPGALSLLSSGRILEGNRIEVRAPDGHVGEIYIRSDSLLTGYYNRPDLTAQALSDGWYRTKDRGFLLDGELFVLGRTDDLVIIGGKNIYPQDIEEIVSRHPCIHDGRAVAFGVPNEELGTEDLIVVAEAHCERDLECAADIETEIRQQVVAEIGVAPRVVYVAPPKWIVKSTAGKPARSTTRQKYLNIFREESALIER